MTMLFHNRFLNFAWVLVLLAAGTAVVVGCRKASDREPPLTCHVGGTMRPVIQELAEMYEQKTGRKVEINYAGSGELLAHIESHKEGDLYVCHDPFLDILMARGLGSDGWTVAELTPVIVVRKGNPKKIKGLRDAVAPDVSLVLTDFNKSTLGWMLPKIFEKAGIDVAKLKARPNLQTFRKGGQAANVVKSGNADAAIVWNAVAHLRTDALDVVPIVPEHLPVAGVDVVTTATGKTYPLSGVRVTIATLKCSQRPQAARDFAEFVASPEATKVFGRYGFTERKISREYQAGKKAT